MDDELLLAIHRAWGSIRKHGKHPPYFPGAQPVSLEKRHIPILHNRHYFISNKLDGIRMGFICSNDKVFFINRKMDIFPVDFRVEREFFKGTMLDGEMMSDGTYIVYDAVMICGHVIRNYNMIKRLTFIYKYVKKLPFKIKKFYLFHNHKYFLENIYTHDADGIIFTPIDEAYKHSTNDKLFKWKPVKNITVDYAVKNGNTYIQDRNNLVFVDSHEWCNDYDDGSIIECEYINNVWTPVKIRSDKDYPNSVITYNKIMLNIRENIKISDIIG